MPGELRRSTPRVLVVGVVAVALALLVGFALVRVLTKRVQPLAEVPGGSTLPAAPAGFRWVTYHDASVLVPDGWGAMNGPGYLDCPGRWAGEQPLVITPQRGPRSAGVCAVTIKEPEVASPYVLFSDRPGVPFTDEGHFATQQVGDAWVTVVWFRASQRDVVNEVFRSARTTEVDADGCPVNSPGLAALSAWDGAVQTPSTVESLSVCQYDFGGWWLYSGFSIEAADAESTWRGLLGGPTIASLSTADCPVGSPGATPAVVWVGAHDAAGETRWLGVDLDDCAGVGVSLDDRTLELSEASCQALLPVRPITPNLAKRCRDR